jgi:hypothetical protein
VAGQAGYHPAVAYTYPPLNVEGKSARIQQWRLPRDAWERFRRDDIELTGVEECLPVLGIG